MDGPRDFVKEAGGWLKTPEPLAVLIARERDPVIAWLVDVLRSGGDMPRKYAAFVLGQIGATEVVDALETAHDGERVRGVRDAMGAGLVALRMTCQRAQLSTLDRRRIITSIYDGKGLPADFL